MFRNVKELVNIAEKENILISEVMIRQEMEAKEKTREDVYSEMEKNLDVMEKASADSLKGVESVTGLTGGDAVLIKIYMKEKTALAGHLLMDAVSKAMGTNVFNAAMGTICATP